ncbi:hypothetical protein X970_10565 [Pseudomonas monteilii SB3101]|uniref:Uncharacterized protein n=1 Tax=Pseudomonas monteilii SB3101 TaxID=1435058 RepID=V9V823_9PSED|nr:hypothetical protein X969_10910 [Pseudomonas monteilii SB3078]AHC91066.1 hypothetical protein X970_10565 [Pseudomonas monteilii SB3101]OUS82853.1 hypothetical protein CBP05_12865 [Pseudomonas putida]OUS88300.1 hypothetical protein CBP06_10540 [Pseudomonas putida]
MGAYGVRLAEILKKHSPDSVLRFVPESDIDLNAMAAGPKTRPFTLPVATDDVRPGTCGATMTRPIAGSGGC